MKSLGLMPLAEANELVEVEELYMTPQMNADECRQCPVFMMPCFLNIRNYL